MKSFSNWFVGGLVYGLFWLLRVTWRIEEDNWPYRGEREVVFAHWHEDEWALLGAYVGRPMSVLISKSQDGEKMARVMSLAGFNLARGSTSRGGVAGFLSLIRQVRKFGGDASLAVDGPRGPHRVAKEGVLGLSQALKRPLICAGAAASKAWVFHKAWNKAYIPKPFAKIVICYKDAGLALERKESSVPQLEQVQSRLLAVKKLAEDRVRS